MDDSFDISNRHDSEANTAQQSNILNPDGGTASVLHPTAGGNTTIAVTPLTAGTGTPISSGSGPREGMAASSHTGSTQGGGRNRPQMPFGGRNLPQREALAQAQQRAELRAQVDGYYMALVTYAYYYLSSWYSESHVIHEATALARQVIEEACVNRPTDWAPPPVQLPSMLVQEVTAGECMALGLQLDQQPPGWNYTLRDWAHGWFNHCGRDDKLTPSATTVPVHLLFQEGSTSSSSAEEDRRLVATSSSSANPNTSNQLPAEEGKAATPTLTAVSAGGGTIGLNINTSDPKRWTNFRNSKEFRDFLEYCKVVMSDEVSANSFNPHRFIDANVLETVKLNLITAGHEDLSQTFPGDKDNLLPTLEIIKRVFFNTGNKKTEIVDILQRRDEVLLPALRAFNPTERFTALNERWVLLRDGATPEELARLDLPTSIAEFVKKGREGTAGLCLLSRFS